MDDSITLFPASSFLCRLNAIPQRHAKAPIIPIEPLSCPETIVFDAEFLGDCG